jgi:uncharacterized protein (TIGR00369 family)
MSDGQQPLQWGDDYHCFICGKQNPSGLQLDFTPLEGRRLATEWTAEKRFQGYADILHGGIISAILDETMINLPWKLENTPVSTAEMTVRFIKPAIIGQKLNFTAWITGESKRLWQLRSECRNQAGELVAEASAKAMVIKHFR